MEPESWWQDLLSSPGMKGSANRHIDFSQAGSPSMLIYHNVLLGRRIFWFSIVKENLVWVVTEVPAPK